MAELRKWLLEGPPALRVILIALVAGLVCVGAVALADTYTWDQYEDGDWSDITRWTASAECTICYPHTTDDDAIITSVSDGQVIDDNEIYLDDDYDIDSLTFSAVGWDDNIVYTDEDETPRELTCDAVVLAGVNEVYLWEYVTIETD